MVARYIGGLRIQIQDAVNILDPVSVSAAHQRALIIERQSNRHTGSVVQNSGIGSSSGSAGSGVVNRGAGQFNRDPGSSSNMKCFGCGEVGHRKADCKKTAAKKTLFVDADECDDYDAEIEGEPMYDDEAVDELHVEGDVGTALVVRRSCLTPNATEETDWLRSNIFQSTCTIKNKVCRFVIDGGSCENIVSDEAVHKLQIQTEKHPKPYKLVWLKKGGEASVSKRALVSFSIGLK